MFDSVIVSHAMDPHVDNRCPLYEFRSRHALKPLILTILAECLWTWKASYFTEANSRVVSPTALSYGTQIIGSPTLFQLRYAFQGG